MHGLQFWSVLNLATPLHPHYCSTLTALDQNCQLLPPWCYRHFMPPRSPRLRRQCGA